MSSRYSCPRSMERPPFVCRRLPSVPENSDVFGALEFLARILLTIDTKHYCLRPASRSYKRSIGRNQDGIAEGEQGRHQATIIHANENANIPFPHAIPEGSDFQLILSAGRTFHHRRFRFL